MKARRWRAREAASPAAEPDYMAGSRRNPVTLPRMGRMTMTSRPTLGRAVMIISCGVRDWELTGRSGRAGQESSDLENV